MSQIDDLLQRAVDGGAVPGVVALASGANGFRYAGAFGQRDLAEQRPMTIDTVFRIMSMTKAVTSVAAMQLVEQGKLALDQPVASIISAFGDLQVLEGFNNDSPQLRPAATQATVRHLLTHTAGLCYEIWNADSRKYEKLSATPSIISASFAALRHPLVADPGTRWEYGTSIDWLGQVIEAVSDQPLASYLHEHIFAPLGMHETHYAPTDAQRERLATLHARMPDGSLMPIPYTDPPSPDFSTGGHGLFSTAHDYMVFLQMLLNRGSLNDVQLLCPETVALMTQNQTGELDVTPLKTVMPGYSNDFDLFPALQKKHGLGFVITMAQAPGMRAAGSCTWAGLFNTYFWFDPRSQVAGLLMAQILPFADHETMALYADFERAVYEGVGNRE